MNIQLQRAKLIDEYLSEQKEVGKVRIEIAGRAEMHSFYRFPIKLLRYNSENGRLAMEIREWEANHHPLDSSDLKDAIVIRDLLLGLEQIATERLQEDLEQKGQMDPGVITFDGVVINGNRRMAVLEALHREHSVSKWEYLEAVRLPRSISQPDLWKIEAGLQLSKDKVAEYHPVNELLKIKQGIEQKLSPEQIAAAMYGRTPEEVEEALARLNLIDDFLAFFGAPGNYGLIKKHGLHEYFIDIQKHILPVWDRMEVPNALRKKYFQATFLFIRAGILGQDNQSKKKKSGITHWDIRKLGKVFENPDARLMFLQHFEQVKLTPRDKNADKKILSIPAETTIEDFRGAEDVLRMKEQRDQPVRLIEKAISALQSIDRNDKHFREETVKEAMARLSEVVREFEREIAGQ